jgi:hypothetical protein
MFKAISADTNLPEATKTRAKPDKPASAAVKAQRDY